MKQFYTYLHCKPNGDPFYVGKGSGKRGREFIIGRNTHHKNIVKKYGRENIGIFIFPCESERQAFDDEIQQIFQLRTNGYELCNKTNGGEGPCGYKHTEEARKKISIVQAGRMVSEETREKKSISMMGKKHSAESCVKISIARMGNKHSLGNTNWLGKKHTEETKEKMSESHRNISPEIRAKLSEAAKQQWLDPTKRPTRNTQETRKKMSESQKARWNKFRNDKGRD